MKNKILIVFVALLSINLAIAQVGIGTTNPDNSAALDVESTTSGFLPPRMTSDERDLINNPAIGLMIYNTDDNNIQYFDGSAWFEISANLIASTSACGGLTEFTDPRDGQTYALAAIGDQCWFAENLNHTPPAGNSWCYDDNSANCNIYGRLYDWYTLLVVVSSSNTNPSGVQGLCPTGWHVPSDSEWTQLSDFLGGLSEAGGKMKSTIGWNSPNTGATNSSDFSGLPGGYRGPGGGFFAAGTNGIWWSTTENSILSAWPRTLTYDSSDLFRNLNPKPSGFSCRCVRD